MNTEQAICLATVYNFADVSAYAKVAGVDTFCRTLSPSERKRAASVRAKVNRALLAAGIDPNDPAAIRDAYNTMVLDMAADMRPELSEAFDYWGARCLYPSPGWNTPKHGTTMAGNESTFLPCWSPDDIRAHLRP